MKTLIEKLENRKKITGKALQELFALILELEKNLDRDITTSTTTCKVNIKAKGYYLGNRFYSNDLFSLFIDSGKIKIKDIFSRNKKDKNYETYEIKESRSFDYFSENVNDEDVEIIRINFSELVIVLEELMKLTIEESQKIDNDAQEFIDFCLNWRQIKEKK